MKRFKQVVLPILFALTLLASMAAPALAAFCNVPVWLEDTTLVNQILERDGMIDGIWYPWFMDENLGHSLTSNEVMHQYHGLQRDYSTVGMDTYGADNIYREIYNMKALGYNMLAYGGSIYGEGVIYDDNGDVLGIKQQYLDNVRRLLDMCRDVGMPVMWTITFHSSSLPSYWSNQAWNIITQMYCNPKVTEHYAERFVKPLCRVLGEYPDVVALIALTDEENNDTNDSELGNHFSSREHWGVTQHDMVYFMSVINDAVKETVPNIPRTCASSSENSAMFSELDLDLIGCNRYTNNGGAPTTESYHTSVPMLLTEYNVGNEFNAGEEPLFMQHQKFREAMMQYGYAGGFQWCWMPNLSGGGQDMLARPYQTSNFRGMQYMLYHYIEEYRAANRGEELVLDTPSLFANYGNKKVEWIASRQATKMDLLRSVDGGKTWKKVLDNVDPALYVDANGKGTYTDNNAPDAHYNYKIVVRDDKGNEKESAPNNVPEQAEQYPAVEAENPIVTAGSPPKSIQNKNQTKLISFGVETNRPVSADKNLILNGSFEEEAGGQWNNRSFLCPEIQVVKDETAPNGDKVLYFNTSKKEAGWYTFTVDVEPNTEYILSAWLKGAFISDDNRFNASFGVLDPDQAETGFMLYYDWHHGIGGCMRASQPTQQLFPTAWDEEWHLRSVAFNSGNLKQVTLALYGEASQLWLDDIALYKLTDGIKYAGKRLTGALKGDMATTSSCPPEKSLTEDVNVVAATSAFWQSGAGWKNGFMSVVDTESEYGYALKYIGSEQPVGVYYTKWIDVKPNTDYVFSVDLKILETGFGSIALCDDKISGPVNMLEIDFDMDSFGEEWFTFGTAFNSDVFTRVGIAVCDRGGSALLDNIRIYEVADGDAYNDVVDTGWAYDAYEENWYFVKNHYPVEDAWVEFEGGRYYVDEFGYRVIDTWMQSDKGWSYLGEDGKAVVNAWIDEYYVDGNGYRVVNAWKKAEGGWRYLGADGKVTTNKWVKDSVGWCYLGEDGYAVTNTWKKDSHGWCYLNGSGSMTKNAWVKDGGKWYFLDQNGYMVTNAWKKDSKGWVYVGKDGAMLTNAWCKDSQGWCYVGADGYAVTNCWKKDSKGWIWLNASGSMTKNTWIKDGGKWYFLDAEGYMATNAWKKDSKGWVYVGSDGAMKTNAWVKDSKGWCYVGSDGYAVTECWKKDSIGWIYLDKNGSMTKSKWIQDGGKWYYLDANGYMVAGKTVTIGGEKYTFNAKGEWVK